MSESAELSKKALKKAKKRVASGSGTAAQVRAVYGAAAAAAVELLPSPTPPMKDSLLLSEVQNVLLWSLTHEQGEMPRWLSVRNKPLIRGALVILTSALTQGDVHDRCLAFTRARRVKLPKSHHSRTAAAAASELLQVKLPRKRKAAAMEAAAANEDSEAAGGAPASTHPARLPCGRWKSSYVRAFGLSRAELRENGYPIAGEAAARRDFLPLRDGTGGNDGGGDVGADLVAIDCEMVLVRGDHMVDGGWPLVKQLARVALVDGDGTRLIDEFVTPEKPVVDYLTRFSGVTEALLRERATLTFHEVRERVLTLLAGKVLIGHSLESDLDALRIAVPPPKRAAAAASAPSDAISTAPVAAPAASWRPTILDTAVLYPLRVHHHGPPTKAALRNLSVTHLKREIQQPNEQMSSARPGNHASSGHDPVEDALAAMDLAKLKLERGIAYGTPGASWGVAYEPMHDALARAGWTCHLLGGQGSNLISALPPARPAALGSPAAPAKAGADAAVGTPNRDSLNVVGCATDHELVEIAATLVNSSQQPFVWLTLGDTAATAAAEAVEETTTSDTSPPPTEAHAALLAGLFARLPADTLVVLLGTAHAPDLSAIEGDDAMVAKPGEDDDDAEEEERAGANPADAAPAENKRHAQKRQHAVRDPPPGWVTFAVSGPGGAAGGASK